MIKFIAILGLIILSGKELVYEQKAIDYFFETIWDEDLSEYNIVEFSGKTDTSSYMRNQIWGCEWDTTLKDQYVESKSEKIISLVAEKDGLRIKKTSNAKRLKFYVAPYRQFDDIIIVQMYVFKPKLFVNHYLLQLDVQGNVIEVCTVYEVI